MSSTATTAPPSVHSVSPPDKRTHGAGSESSAPTSSAPALWQHALASAGAAGVASGCVFPLDRLALRLQMVGSAVPPPAAGLQAPVGSGFGLRTVSAAMTGTWREISAPGATRGLPVGVASAFVGRGSATLGNEAAHRMLGDDRTSPVANFLCGGLGGLAECGANTWLNGIRAIQVRPGNTESPMQVFQRVGFRHLMQPGPIGAAWDFGFYAILFPTREMLRQQLGTNPDGSTPAWQTPIASTVATLGTNPFHLVLTRAQAGCMETPSLWGLPKTVVRIAQKEGVRALMHGAAPRCVSNAMFVPIWMKGYETAMAMMASRGDEQ